MEKLEKILYKIIDLKNQNQLKKIKIESDYFFNEIIEEDIEKIIIDIEKTMKFFYIQVNNFNLFNMYYWHEVEKIHIEEKKEKIKIKIENIKIEFIKKV